MVVKATRHTAMLRLHHATPLLSTLHGFDIGPRRKVTTIVPSITIISARIRTAQISPGRTLDVQFWSNAELSTQPSFSLLVEVPPFWTPQIHLAAIYTSLEYNEVMLIASITSPWDSSDSITTINDLLVSFFGIQNESELKCHVRWGLHRISGGKSL